jgi:hypothetical protein
MATLFWPCTSKSLTMRELTYDKLFILRSMLEDLQYVE